jgi:hypothetical protein
LQEKTVDLKKSEYLKKGPRIYTLRLPEILEFIRSVVNNHSLRLGDNVVGCVHTDGTGRAGCSTARLAANKATDAPRMADRFNV